MRFHSFALILLLPLCGFGTCSKKPEQPKLPEVVHITVEKQVPVDSRLTKPCPAKRAESRTVEAVVAAYNANLIVLQDCDTRMGEIRALGR
ncbi:Rz1-like lysis system protein LysC [Stenotrophomonas maltophilia]|uniref:Rz1-like lysis system protein LysC n=1 Tax=Stenotrophomonas maltophilia TaxID=40324 RepID=UPI0040437C6A